MGKEWVEPVVFVEVVEYYSLSPRQHKRGTMDSSAGMLVNRSRDAVRALFSSGGAFLTLRRSDDGSLFEEPWQWFFKTVFRD